MDCKAGDRVHVAGTVLRKLSPSLTDVRLDGMNEIQFQRVDNHAIVHVEPRPLAVGDKVRSSRNTACIYVIKAIDGDMAWVRVVNENGTEGFRFEVEVGLLARLSSTP